MLHLSFGHSFAELVALILLPGLAFFFLNKKEASVRRNEEVADTGAPGSMTTPTEANSDGSSSLPTETHDGASSPSPTETNSEAKSGGSSSSPTETNNGASSSLTATTGNRYEVFLSFRGADTRYGFTDHLYHGLLNAGIETFRDDDELPRGEDIKPVLMEAIANSKVLIPIFSESYGTSDWCLDELVQMMKRKNNNGQMVLPVFYKVKPSDVGHLRGSFGDAFLKREKRLLKRGVDPTILENWKKTLLEVSTLSGFEAVGYEADLVESIVRKVLSELKKKFELDISENLVGIDGHVQDIMDFVDTKKSHASLFVGIHGMGGIGKTTLAKAIYNKLSNKFEHRSFIADISESWKRNGAHYLQNQLIYDISNRQNEVHNENEGVKYISSKFKGKKVLLLLDDVDDVVQLKHLAGSRDWFSLGSMIIITTRNERILKEFAVDYAYDHKEMDNDQSLILFSKHAFRREFPTREFEDLSHEVVSITRGLPLSLEVLGSLLCGQKPTFWRGTIDKLKKVPPKKVREKLRISYDVLDDEQQQIFLDIACFFIGTDKRIASYMWDACHFVPEEGIEVLRFMSLIKIGDDHELQMHDQLRDLGREIVREENKQKPQNRSRLWDAKEGRRVLKQNKGTEKIEAIDLSGGSSEDSVETDERVDDIYTGEQFKNLTSLRFLHMEKAAHLSGDFKDSMEGLRWLRWRQCPMNFEVNNFPVKELAVLELPRSTIKDKWEGWSFFMMAEKLKFLDLTACAFLENTDFLSAFKNLEVLILNHCWRLQKIDPSIGDMKALLRLELSSCVGLTKLPEEIGKLKALKQLLLNGTRKLCALPKSVGSLENLEILNIHGAGVEELPIGIGRLRKLRDLDASYCIHLKGERTESMRNLSSLQRLNFRYCTKLQSLPDLPSSLTYLGVTCKSRKLPSLSHLSRLRKVEVSSCEFLERIQELPSTLVKNSECSQPTGVEESELSQSLNTPFKLEILDVRGCESIEILDVSQFIHLRTLSIHDCWNLLEVRGLYKMKYLECLTVDCNSIERLDLSKFESLMKLDVRNCIKLAEIQNLDGLDLLEELDITGCRSIKKLHLPKSEDLTRLNAERCKILAEIQGLDMLESLEELNISRCDSMERLLFPKFGRLKKLHASYCPKLAEIQGLDGLELLEELIIIGCTSIKKLRLPKCEVLMRLNAGGCKILAEIQGLDMLESLEELNISGCDSMERLLFPKSGRLKKLDARDCTKLAEIQGLDGLELLGEIYISGCTSIKKLRLPKSEGLMRLDADWCQILAEIQGFEMPNISPCTSIECLDLPKSRSMEELHARGFLNLANFQELQPLKFLKKLDISMCAPIERLDLPKSDSLNKLNAAYCESLVEIQGLGGLESLEELNLYGCVSIGRLGLQKSMVLEKLDTNNCANLVEIQGLDRLERLTRLNVFGCTSFERLPNLYCFDYLESLTIYGCDKLQDIQSLEGFPSCKSLQIVDCKSLAKLPNLSSFRDLRKLFLSNCYELQEIPGLEESISLERIAILGCSSIEILPNFSSCTLLMSLIVQDCEKLTEIQGLEKLKQLVELNISGCKSLETIPE